MKISAIVGILLFSLCLAGCKKETSDVYTDNDAPYYDKVPSVKVRNYVNRLFIDLLGREPLDTEMDAETAAIQAGDAKPVAREALINKLMSDESFRDGDTSYTLAYHKRMYELGKIRFLEGVSDEGIRGEISIARQDALSDSLSGNIAGYEDNMAIYTRLMNLLNSRANIQNGSIDLYTQYGYMIENKIYDYINMNTFNFVNACFDNLLFRYPTDAEFQVSFSMVEDNIPGTLFGTTAQNKSEFVQLITRSVECKSGTIQWVYNTLLARNPTTTEMELEMQRFGVDNDLKALQRRILVTNEYANF